AGCGRAASSGATASSTIALTSDDRALWVVNPDADSVTVIDPATRAALAEIPVGAAPVGVVAAPDGSAVYAVSHEAAVVTKIDPKKDTVVGTLDVGEHPWGASVSADGRSLYVSHLLVGAGVTTIDTRSFTVRSHVELAEQEHDDVKTLPQGVVRGVYSVVPQPTTGVLWAPHLLLAIHTP